MAFVLVAYQTHQFPHSVPADTEAKIVYWSFIVKSFTDAFIACKLPDRHEKQLITSLFKRLTVDYLNQADIYLF